MAIYSGNNLVATKGGVSNYPDLDNKPQINNVILTGNKTAKDLGLQAAGDYALKSEIPTSTSDLTNNSNFITTTDLNNIYSTNHVWSGDNTYTKLLNRQATLSTDPTVLINLQDTNDKGYAQLTSTYDDSGTLHNQLISHNNTANKTSYLDLTCDENNGYTLETYSTANYFLNDTSITRYSDVKDEINKSRTNCITKIPQDIKLELNNGALTLKAGSVYYKCDGNFTKYTTSEDQSRKPTVSAQLFMYIDENNNFAEYFVDRFFSGNSAPTVSSSTAFWYDTTTKKMKKTLDTGGSWFESNISLPMALVTCDTTQGITSIDQVFNGFGYIDNTVFALPGVEGLCPNGFNNDGTYNNTIFTLNKVIFGEAATIAATQLIQATLNGILLPSAYNYKIFNNKKEVLDFTQLASTMSFDCYIINENKQYYYNQNNTPIFSQNNRFECGTIETDGERIISFKPSYAFAAVNINQIENIIADTPTSIYQKMFNVPGVTISLQTDKSIYKLSNISVNMHLTFGMGSLKKVYTDRVITFELYIPVSSTVPTITWPTGVVWLAEETPTFEANTNYLFAFRSFDQGVNWIGNMQCSWPNA